MRTDFRADPLHHRPRTGWETFKGIVGALTYEAFEAIPAILGTALGLVCSIMIANRLHLANEEARLTTHDMISIKFIFILFVTLYSVIASIFGHKVSDGDLVARPRLATVWCPLAVTVSIHGLLALAIPGHVGLIILAGLVSTAAYALSFWLSRIWP